MTWVQAEDVFYYTICRNILNKHPFDILPENFAKEYQEYQKYFESFKTLIMLPSLEEIKQHMGEEDVCFISTTPPPEELAILFKMVYLDNLYGILTTQEHESGIGIEQSMEKKFGLKTTKPKLNFSNLKGSYGFKEWAKRVELSKARNYAIKPVMLIGVPGVGKTYGAVCYAGERGVPLMQLDLSVLAERKDPVSSINRVFAYLSGLDNEIVLLIDELEQMLTSGNEAILGALLTIFNDLNTHEGYKLNGILFATSNNITNLTQKFPQFIRHGRWNEKFFVHFPFKAEALDVMALCRDKYNLPKEWFDASKLELIYIRINKEFKEFNIHEKRNVYSNSEIGYLFERISLWYDDNQTEDEKNALVYEQIKAVEPLQKTTHDAIQQLLKDAQLNRFQEI